MLEAEGSATPDFDAGRVALSEGNVAALARWLGQWRGAEKLDLSSLASSLVAVSAPSATACPDRTFAAVIGESLDLTAYAGVLSVSGVPECPARLRSVDQDYIAQPAGLAEFTAVQAASRLALERIPFRPGSRAIVVTMRDDGVYILQLLAHYRMLGFEHFFVFTNDNADGSDQLLDRLAEAGLVTVIDNEITGEVPPEAKAFGYAMNLLPALWQFEWAMFIDSDEYLMLAPEFADSIANVLDRLQFRHGARAGAILYDWLWFISDMAFRRTPGLLCERFQHAREHWLGKCLVRLRDVSSMRRQHCPDLLPGRILVDSAFDEVEMEGIWTRRQAQYRGGTLNHYWPRSFEEFAIKKARGASLQMSSNLYDRPYTSFFKWNGWADEQNHRPSSPLFVRSLRREIASLQELPGVQQAAREVELGFAERLASICTPEQLLETYTANRVPPGDL